MVRVSQFNEHFVRTRGKTHQDDRLPTRVCPHPCGIVDGHMKVSDARRDSQRIGAEHRHKVQVLRTIVDNRHPPRGERFGQRRIGDDLRWGSSLVSGITGVGPHVSLALCAKAVIAYNTMAATDSRDVPLGLVYVSVAIFFPSMPSSKSTVRVLHAGVNQQNPLSLKG
jgi:hypothetical protein